MVGNAVKHKPPIRFSDLCRICNVDTVGMGIDRPTLTDHTETDANDSCLLLVMLDFIWQGFMTQVMHDLNMDTLMSEESSYGCSLDWLSLKSVFVFGL